MAVDAPPGDLLMCGKTELTLMRNVLEPLSRATSGLFAYSVGNHRASFLGRNIYLIGANDEQAERKIRGSTLAGAYPDELTLYPQSFWKMLLSRLRVPGAKLFGTTNPDSPYHYLKTEFIDRKDELDLNYFTWDIDENTYLSPDYVNALKREYTGLWYKRFILGEWVSAEGAVFDFFDEALHVRAPQTAPQTFDLSCDYGTSNATAVGLFASSGQAVWLERTYYYDGRQSRQRTDAEHADAVDAEFADIKRHHRYFIVDPSAASFKAELKQRGWNVTDADNDVQGGIRVMGTRMKNGEFFITPHESNRVVIKQISGYVWDKKAQARGEDKPRKQNDHSVDMCRYRLMLTTPTRAVIPTMSYPSF